MPRKLVLNVVDSPWEKQDAAIAAATEKESDLERDWSAFGGKVSKLVVVVPFAFDFDFA